MGPLETWCLLSFRGSAYCDTSADGFGTFPHLRRRISPQSTTADGQTCCVEPRRSSAFRIVMVLGPMLSNPGPRLDTRTRLRDGANDRIPSSTHRGRHVFGARHMQLQSGAPKWG